jgi:nitroreductase
VHGIDEPMTLDERDLVLDSRQVGANRIPRIGSVGPRPTRLQSRAMDVFEAMGTAVSMRWLKPDPVPDELVDRLLWAATRASNPGNVQPWHFVVVRDEATRRELAGIMTDRLGGIKRLAQQPLPEDPGPRRMIEGVGYLVEHLADPPVLVFVCGNNVYPPNAPQEHMMYSAVFGAAQNLLVAARALGLGAAYTTFHLASEAEIKTRLGIPEATRVCVTIPIGWPGRTFGALNRRPIETVVHYDRW